MVGLWLAYCGPNAHLWWEICEPLVGLWLAYGWPMVGQMPICGGKFDVHVASWKLKNVNVPISPDPLIF